MFICVITLVLIFVVVLLCLFSINVYLCYCVSNTRNFLVKKLLDI